MTSDHDHISMVGRYGQGQHNPMTSRSQGQSQGHQGRFRFWPILRIFANSSYSSHRRGLEMLRNVPCGPTKNAMRRNVQFLPSRSDIVHTRSNTKIDI